MLFVDPSALKSKLAAVAKVSVGESVEKSETGNTIEPGWRRRDTYNSELSCEAKTWKPDSKTVCRKRARIGTTQRYELPRETTAV